MSFSVEFADRSRTAPTVPAASPVATEIHASVRLVLVFSAPGGRCALRFTVVSSEAVPAPAPEPPPRSGAMIEFDPEPAPLPAASLPLALPDPVDVVTAALALPLPALPLPALAAALPLHD